MQPANVLPGTTLYTLADSDTAPDGNSFWTVDAPTPAASPDADAGGWNSGSHVLVHTVPQGEGVKAWAGEGVLTGRLQVWVPGKTATSATTKRFRMGAAA